MWLERAQTEGLLEAAVVYGYFRCVSSGNDLIVLGEDGHHRAGAVQLPAAAARPAAVPGRLLPPAVG
jgi:cobalamin-dependent methionine synthase I